MINILHKKILILAVKAGSIMLESGAEIYRVEDTVTRIMKVAGITYADVYATPTGIFVTMDEGKTDSDVFTYVKRIRGGRTDLTRISMVNRFSRDFSSTDMTVDEGMEILTDIEREKPFALPLRLLGAACIAAFFCLMFGGSILDSANAFVFGIIAYMIAEGLNRIKINFFIREFISCAAASLIALVSFSIGMADSYDMIIIGVMMIFAPGVAITNSIRDFLSGDMVSGVARVAEAIMIATALACGAGLVLEIWIVLGGAI